MRQHDHDCLCPVSVCCPGLSLVRPSIKVARVALCRRNYKAMVAGACWRNKYAPLRALEAKQRHLALAVLAPCIRTGCALQPSPQLREVDLEGRMLSRGCTGGCRTCHRRNSQGIFALNSNSMPVCLHWPAKRTRSSVSQFWLRTV